MNVGSILSRLLKNTGDDVVGKISSSYNPANIAKLASSSADDIAATQGNLIATHQLYPEKLAKAADLDLQLAKLAKEGKRGIDPYVLGLGGVLPTAGILSSLLGGKDNEPIA